MNNFYIYRFVGRIVWIFLLFVLWSRDVYIISPDTTEIILIPMSNLISLDQFPLVNLYTTFFVANTKKVRYFLLRQVLCWKAIENIIILYSWKSVVCYTVQSLERNGEDKLYVLSVRFSKCLRVLLVLKAIVFFIYSHYLCKI